MLQFQRLYIKNNFSTMKLNMILFGITVCCLLACKKEKNEPVIYPDYGNLKAGNYWIYQRFQLKDGVYTAQNKIDSNYVEKDTLIGGLNYAKLRTITFQSNSTTYQNTFLRDSLHYLVNEKGNILFSSENFTDTIASGYQVIETPDPDTIFYYFTKMADDQVVADVPAGSFATKNFKTTYLLFPKYVQNGNVREVSQRYAEDVGLVEETLGAYISAPTYTVRRLVRYGKN